MRNVWTGTIGAKLRCGFALKTLFTRDMWHKQHLDSWSRANMASPERPFSPRTCHKIQKIEILSNASKPFSQRKKHSRNMMRHVPTSTIGAKLRSDFAVETLFTRDTKQNTNLDSWSGTNMASPERPLSPRTCHRIYIVQIFLGASKPFSHRTCCKCALPKT